MLTLAMFAQSTSDDSVEHRGIAGPAMLRATAQNRKRALLYEQFLIVGLLALAIAVGLTELVSMVR